MSKSDRINEATKLGMNPGTARHRLVRMILFSLVVETGRDTCFKCGEKIGTVSELSVEHKLPWLYNDASLFWDLTNIAFSHLKCNLPHHTRGRVRKLIPEGTAWCSKHMDFLPTSSFSVNNGKAGGLQSICKECRRSLNKGRYRA